MFGQAEIEKLRRNHHYLVVTNRKNKRLLRGATRMWKRNPRLLYLPDYRITGELEEIITFLREHDYPTEGFTYYSIDNYQTVMKIPFRLEIILSKEGLTKTISKRELISIEDLENSFQEKVSLAEAYDSDATEEMSPEEVQAAFDQLGIESA